MICKRVNDVDGVVSMFVVQVTKQEATPLKVTQQ